MTVTEGTVQFVIDELTQSKEEGATALTVIDGCFNRWSAPDVVNNGGCDRIEVLGLAIDFCQQARNPGHVLRAFNVNRAPGLSEPPSGAEHYGVTFNGDNAELVDGILLEKKEGQQEWKCTRQTQVKTSWKPKEFDAFLAQLGRWRQRKENRQMEHVEFVYFTVADNVTLSDERQDDCAKLNVTVRGRPEWSQFYTDLDDEVGGRHTLLQDIIDVLTGFISERNIRFVPFKLRHQQMHSLQLVEELLRERANDLNDLNDRYIDACVKRVDIGSATGTGKDGIICCSLRMLTERAKAKTTSVVFLTSRIRVNQFMVSMARWGVQGVKPYFICSLSESQAQSGIDAVDDDVDVRVTNDVKKIRVKSAVEDAKKTNQAPIIKNTKSYEDAMRHKGHVVILCLYESARSLLELQRQFSTVFHAGFFDECHRYRSGVGPRQMSHAVRFGVLKLGLSASLRVCVDDPNPDGPPACCVDSDDEAFDEPVEEEFARDEDSEDSEDDWDDSEDDWDDEDDELMDSSACSF